MLNISNSTWGARVRIWSFRRCRYFGDNADNPSKWLSEVSFFQRDRWTWRLESRVPVSFAHVQERPMPTLTDTTLTVRCPYCMAGIEFSPMIAYKDGRFVCRDCAHTVRPGVPAYKCLCRPCVRLSRKSLLTDHGSHLLTQ